MRKLKKPKTCVSCRAPIERANELRYDRDGHPIHATACGSLGLLASDPLAGPIPPVPTERAVGYSVVDRETGRVVARGDFYDRLTGRA